MSIKTLHEIHEDVPPEHYDRGIKKNIFQKYWHKKRFKEITKLLKPVKGPILDVGCHGGYFTEVIVKRLKNKKIHGVDISSGAIALAKKRIPFGKFKTASGEKLPFKESLFEAVFCLEMLEHVDRPDKVLKEIKRVLKKDGYGIVLVPTDNKLFKTIWFLWTLKYPVWRHAHVQSFKGKDLEKKIKYLGLKITQVKNFNLGMLKAVVFEKK